MRTTLISFDLQSGFGVFKKPDVNQDLQLTYNMMHKPALLGILGAIVGLEGYQKRGEYPAYYQALRHLRVGIEPLRHEKGNFVKTSIKYTNTVGYANLDGTLIVTEQTLRFPAYRCYALLDLDEPLQALLHERILAGEAEYLPYIGKNECAAWWEEARTHEFSETSPPSSFEVATIFAKDGLEVRTATQEGREETADILELDLQPENFIYFERLPLDFNEHLVQYRLVDFAYTKFRLKPGVHLEGLVHLTKENKYVQLL